MKYSPKKSNRRIPLGILILIVGILGMAAVVVISAFTLRFGSFSFLREANRETEYLTIEQFQVDAPIPSGSLSAPLEAATEAPSAQPTEPLYINVSKYATLQFGDVNSSVTALHLRLMELGYMDYDEESSLYTVSTENAVKLFQRANNLIQTGIATSELQEMLFAEDAQAYRAKSNDNGVDIRSAQERLSELGYYYDKVSGYYGPQTEMAVRMFQSKNNMAINGEINRDVYTILYSDEAVPLATPTPVPTKTPVPGTPKPTVKATAKATVKATAKATAKPTAKPTNTPKPTKTPKPTAAPTLRPGQTPSPTPKLTKTPKPTATPKVTATPKPTKTPKPTATPKPTKTPKPTATPKVTNTPRPEKSDYGSGISGMIACAEAQIGDPYVYGAEGPDSFDCSGLAYYCMKKAGLSVSRTSSSSYANNNKWKKIESISDLKKGDLIFWCNDKSSKVSHVGICTGGGSFIHASSSKGEVCRSSFGGSSSYWVRNFVCGRRPFE